MKTVGKLLLLASLLSFMENTMAASVWIKNVTIKSASYYYDGSNDVWAITWEDDLITGCSHANNRKQASWWSNSVSNRWDIGAARVSPAMAAVAAGLKADIMIDPAVCSASYGAKLNGVKIIR